MPYKDRSVQKEFQAHWYQKNRETIRNESNAKRKREPFNELLRKAKERHKEKGYAEEFNLDEVYLMEIFPKDGKCPYLGCELVFMANSGKGGGSYNSASIDRIDNTRGYVIGNVQIVSRLYNVMKTNSTFDQLMAFCFKTVIFNFKKCPAIVLRFLKSDQNLAEEFGTLLSQYESQSKTG